MSDHVGFTTCDEHFLDCHHAQSTFFCIQYVRVCDICSSVFVRTSNIFRHFEDVFEKLFLASAHFFKGLCKG